MSHLFRAMGSLRLGASLLLFSMLPSCAMLQSIRALSEVQFSLSDVHRVELAGVVMDDVRSYEDLSLVEVLRVGTAVAQGTVPLTLTLELSGQNPQHNPEARMVALDWTLFLRDRETVRGSMDDEVRFAPGETTMFPLRVSLDLAGFLQGGAQDLIEVALALAREDGEAVGLRLEVLPTVHTRLGTIQYTRPLVLER